MKNTEAIIVAKNSYSEADEIITLLTKEYGKISVRARGVKKSGAKLAGNLQFLNWLNLFFVVGRSFPIATDTFVKESFSSIKASVAKLEAASMICSTVDKIIPSSDIESDEDLLGDVVLWEQLLGYLVFLENYSYAEENLSLAPTIFVYQMLSLHGFRPILSECAVCGIKTQGEKGISFSPSAGGVIDEGCLKEDPSAISISEDFLGLLEEWRVDKIDNILKNTALMAGHDKITRLIERFGEWHLGVPLNLKFSSAKIAKRV